MNLQALKEKTKMGFKNTKLYGLPWYVFLLAAVLTLVATYLGVLPGGMVGCILFMLCLGNLLAWLGEHIPIVRTYLGGGPIVVIFGSALLVYLDLIPSSAIVDGDIVYNMSLPFGQLDLLTEIKQFFSINGGFLDFYIAALITGSILGMNRKLLVKSAVRYFPTIFGGLICAFLLCCLAAWIMGYPVTNALLLIGLPIMGGGMGAGASPLSKIFETSSSMSAAEALSIMTPAIAIGNAISIVLAGVLSKVVRGKLNGNGQLMKNVKYDKSDEENSKKLLKMRDDISIGNLGVGLLASGLFFAMGYVLPGIWNFLDTGFSIHAYAWMIILVAVLKITNIVPVEIEVACHQWYQFILKNMTNVLLAGIGICYLEIGMVIDSFSVTYLLLCSATCVGAFVGAAVVGKFVGFYPFEAGVTGGLCMSNMGGTGDVAVLSSSKRMELMPFAQISSRLGGSVVLLVASLMLSTLAKYIVV